MKLVTTLTQTDAQNPPLVLIHGLGSAATVFKLIVPQLSNSFRVITIDLPGHGDSPLIENVDMDPKSLGSAIFESIMNEYGIDKFHVAGNSLGGWIALEMAAHQPDRILSLTGLAPAGLWLEPSHRRTLSEARAHYLAKILKPFIKPALRFQIMRRIGFSLVSPQWQKLSYESCLDASMAMAYCKGYFSAWDGMLNRRFDSYVPPRVPVTILFGDSDNTLPRNGSQERTLAPSHCTWQIIANCGHAPMWDHPDLIVGIIKDTSH